VLVTAEWAIDGGCELGGGGPWALKYGRDRSRTDKCIYISIYEKEIGYFLCVASVYRLEGGAKYKHVLSTSLLDELGKFCSLTEHFW
jgi:hypothetical protein